MCENSKQFFKSSGGRFTINVIVVETLARCYYNHFHNISRLFDVLLNLSFTTSETMRNYYLQTWYIRVVSSVTKQLKT